MIKVLEARKDSNYTGGMSESSPQSSHEAVSAGGVFVGRQREMGELRAALEESIAGHGRLAMLVGEPGIGKTRTAQELASYAETRGGQVLWGRCYEEEGAPPYWPWVQVIRSYVQSRSTEQLHAEMGPGAADIADIVPEIRRKLTDLETPPALQPEQARFRLFDSITIFLKSAARSQPLMLVLDDLHWADEPSLLLLQFLAQQLADSCILVVGCYRDVELSRQHPLSETLARVSREAVYQRHLLRGLNRDDTAHFIESAAGTNVSRNLVEAVFAHTEGNPYFTTEVIQLLSDRGELAEEAVGGAAGIRIPEGVREVIGQRLNRLSGDCNRVLSTAAVIGREFTVNLLNRLIDGPSEDRLLEILEEALAARLIEELPPNVGLYQFNHRLVQESLIQELSLTRRVRLHARIAQAIEELYEQDLESHASVLAYHYAQAEAITGAEKLVHYSFIAGEQALAAYAYEEAQTHFQRALASKEGEDVDAETAAVLFGLGRAQAATGGRLHFLEALDSWQRAFEYYYGVGDVDRAVAVAGYPVHTITTGIITGAVEVITRALSLVPPNSHQAGRLLSTYGLTLYKETGDYDGAQHAFHQVLAIARREQDPALEMRTLAGAAEVAWWQLRLSDAVAYGRQAVDLAGRVDDPQSEILARTFMGRALTAMGESEEAANDSAAMLTTAERLRDRGRLADTVWRISELCFFQGKWEDARAYIDPQMDTARQSLNLLTCLAVMQYEAGDFISGEATMARLMERRSLAATEFRGFT